MKNLLYTLTATLLVSSILVFIACNKNSSDAGSSGATDPNHIPAEQTVTASLQGRVVDETGLPVQGAAVASGGTTTTTDVNGVFTFKDISMSSRFGFVKVNKQGYFTGSRSIITNASASNYVSIQLIPRVEKGNFTAAAGGSVVVQTGDTVRFTGTSVVNAATNASYTGNVHVFATYLDPTAANLSKYMPGDLRGIDTSGRETGLQSFGMMGVELEGDGGEKLQIAAGQKATLSWAIPASLQATAPATIPLWYFNDTTGRWIEQGMAVRLGNNYIGQVGHFSYWNCDAPSGTVNFKVHLKDQHGNAVAYTYIQFQTADWGTRGGYTDSSGYAQGLIPKGQSMVFQVITECGNMLAGVNVGPALGDQDLGTITVMIEDAELTLTGTVVDCSNNPVDSGFVSVKVDGLNYGAAVTKGNFTLPINRCFSTTAPVTLTAGDYLTSQQGSTTSITASVGTVDVGQLSACGVTYSQIITCTINNKVYTWTTPPDDVSYNYSTFNGGNNSATDLMATSTDGRSIDIQVTDLSGVNTYQAARFYMVIPGTGLGYRNSAQVQVTDYGAVNGYIVGTLNGSAVDSMSNQTYPLTGNFKVQRTQ